jgi:signal transduction histidine kinase
VAQSVGPAFARDQTEGARRADMLLGLTRAALGEMRALLSELRPMREEDRLLPTEPAALARVARDGLVAGLRAHAASSSVTGLDVLVIDDGYVAQPASREAALFRIAQEALHNVIKHARATRAEVRLAVRDGIARMCVRDNGVGLSPTAGARRADRPAGGLGLVSMRERATEQGGTLTIERIDGGGTVVEASIPLAREGTS